MFEPTIPAAEPLSSRVGSFTVHKTNTMPSTTTSPALNSTNFEISNEQQADQDTTFSPEIIISLGNPNLTTTVTTTTASMSSSTTTSETANNSSDNVIESGSASRKTSTASEYTSLSSDYTPDNTITSSTSAFTTENPSKEICNEILTSPTQSIADAGVSNTLFTSATSNAVSPLETPENPKDSGKTSDAVGLFTEAERVTYIQTSNKNDMELVHENINEQGQKSIDVSGVIPPVSLIPAARKISRFLVNPVITSSVDGTLEVTTTSQANQRDFTSMLMKTDERIDDSKDRVSHSSTQTQEDNRSVIPDLSAIVSETTDNILSNPSTSVLITAAPISMASSNTITTSSILSVVGSNNTTNNTLEQLKIELENITHAHAFANSVVASLNNTTDQNQISQQSTTQTPITALSTTPTPSQQQHQDEVVKSVGVLNNHLYYIFHFSVSVSV